MTASFEFRGVPIAGLPPLAWAAEFRRGSHLVIIRHGLGVETGDGWFVEGAWSADFTAPFVSAYSMTGTGGVAGPRATFATSTNTLRALYMCRTPDGLVISNSMAFALTAAGDRPRSDYAYYEYDFVSVVHELRRYKRAVQTERGTIEIFYHCNMTVDENLDVLRQDKPMRGVFADFPDYFRFLQGEASAIATNATDPRRTFPYRIMATVSTGYDSPACAVLARNAGCKEALTFINPRDNAESDSGKAIGELLGLNVIEQDALAYKGDDTPACREAEFTALGVGGDDTIFLSAERMLHGTLLFTGFHGDKVWDRRPKKPGPDIVRGDPSGLSASEFGMRIGLQNFAVPFAGCTQLASIAAISNSAEMKPWSMDGSSYDRPIPRRIVEEAGIPRTMFGMSKKMVSRPYSGGMADPPLDTIFSKSSMADFHRWCERDGAVFGPLMLLKHAVSRTAYRAVVASGRLWQWQVALERYRKPLSDRNRLFLWGNAHMRRRYEAALTEV